jgi:hypothetical protein
MEMEVMIKLALVILLNHCEEAGLVIILLAQNFNFKFKFFIIINKPRNIWKKESKLN